MKNLPCWLFFLLLFSFYSCKTDPPASQNESIESGLQTTETTQEQIPEDKVETQSEPLSQPVPDKTDLAILDDQTKNSLFYSLGCCATVADRQKTCCCQAVIDKYKTVRESKDDALILKIKTKDPLFSNCKKIKKWRALIEGIETPVKAEEEEFDF